MHKKIFFSLAIITKNRHHDLQECLLSIAAQTQLPDEIIIIDSSTNNKTKTLCRDLKKDRIPALRYIFEPLPGYSQGRNRAIQESRGVWLGYIDDDCVLDRSWVQQMKAFCNTYPSASAIEGQGKTYIPTNVFALAAQFYEVFWKQNAIRGTTIVDLEILDTKNIVFKRQFLLQHHLLFVDEKSNNTTWITHDIDMGMQIQKSGGNAVYQPKAIVLHKDRVTLVGYIKKIYIDTLSYHFYMKKWKHFRMTLPYNGRFSKKLCFTYICNLYHVPTHKKILLWWLLFSTDRFLGMLFDMLRFYK